MYILPLSGLYNRFFAECAALKIVRWIGYQLEWDESGDILNFFNLKNHVYLRIIKNNRVYLSSNKIHFPPI